jgi:sensor histidine kinase YesM
MNDALHDAQVIAGNTLDDYMLVDATQNVFFSSGDPAWQNEILTYFAEENSDSGYFADGKGLAFQTQSIKNKWTVISYMSDSTIFMLFENYVVNIVLIMAVFLLITMVMLPTVLSRIIDPISQLSEIMSTACMGDWDCEVDVTANDEVGELGRSFNKMLGDLKHSIDIITEKEKMEQKIKYGLLVSQIDPHFIYNTINSINYLARKKRCEDIITVNTALIYILQDRLRVNDIQITDTVEKEMSVVNQYVVIQKFMYDGNFKVRWHVDKDTKLKQIPKNIIQPLVENAIFHGLIDEENGEINGKIDIYIEEKDGFMVLKTQDNGRGIPENELETLKDAAFSLNASERGKNIGISNIRGRLYYLYGEDGRLDIESEPGAGTCITLMFKADL